MIDTGTRRLDLYRDFPQSFGVSPEEGVGMAWSSRYISDAEGDGYCAEIVTYIVEDDDGTFGVEEMSTIGRAIMDDPADGQWRPDDSADIIYEHASALGYSTLESAQEACDRIGQQDISFALYLRPQDNK